MLNSSEAIILGIGLIIFGIVLALGSYYSMDDDTLTFFLFVISFAIIVIGFHTLISVGICHVRAKNITINEISPNEIDEVFPNDNVISISISISQNEKSACQPIELEDVTINNVTPQQGNTDAALIGYSYTGNNNVEIQEKAVMIYDKQMEPGWYEGFADCTVSYGFVFSKSTIPTNIYVTNNADDLETKN